MRHNSRRFSLQVACPSSCILSLSQSFTVSFPICHEREVLMLTQSMPLTDQPLPKMVKLCVVQSRLDYLIHLLLQCLYEMLESFCWFDKISTSPPRPPQCLSTYYCLSLLSIFVFSLSFPEQALGTSSPVFYCIIYCILLH